MRLLTLILLTTLSNQAHAFNGCLSYMKHYVEYGGSFNYVVECATEKFEAPGAITHILIIPLPYHWGNSARANLMKDMSQRNYQEAARIKNGDEPDLIVFDEVKSPNATYCFAAGENQRYIGTSPNISSVYDISIRCSNQSFDKLLPGTTPDAAVALMLAQGFEGIQLVSGGYLFKKNAK